MHGLVEFSLKNRFLILVFTLVVIGVGIWAMQVLPIDAVPDITPNQVQILTGVRLGEKVVTAGSFYLKSALMREQIGGED